MRWSTTAVCTLALCSIAGCGGGDPSFLFETVPSADGGGAQAVDASTPQRDAPGGKRDDASSAPESGGAPPGVEPEPGPTGEEASIGPEASSGADARDEISEPPMVLDSGRDAAVEPGGPLGGQRWEAPCSATTSATLCSSVPAGMISCPIGYRPVGKQVKFGGPTGTAYSVTIRLRGVVELSNYAGGTTGSGHFRIGGMPAGGVNVYGFTVSSPAQTYYINDGSRDNANLVLLDETQTIPIDGGATIDLFAIDTDCIQIRNCAPGSSNCTPLIPPGIPPAPSAFNGQFAQIDVSGVAPR